MKQELVMGCIARLCIKQGVTHWFRLSVEVRYKQDYEMFYHKHDQAVFFLIKVNNENTPIVWEICSSVNNDTFC